MMNFILKYNGTDQPDLKKVMEMLDAYQGCLVDGSLLPKTALLQLEESDMERLQCDLDQDWNIYPEKSYRVPNTEKNIKKDAL